MAWLYVPGAAGSNSDSISPGPDIELFVTSSGKPTPRPHSWRGWKRRSWIKRLSGTICAPSTAAHGVASWISSLRVIPASPSAQLAAAGAPTTPATSGPKSPASSMNAAPNSSSWRMSPTIFVWASVRSTTSWEQWASLLRQDCSRRLKSARDMSASASSSWPTARVADGQGSSYQRDRGQKGMERPTLLGAALLWPTPKAMSGGGNSQRANRNAGGPDLQEVAQSWPTPRACDGDKPSAGNQREHSLTRQAAAWPTPAARDFRSPNSRESQDRRNDGTYRGQQLPNFVEHHFSSPPAPVTDDGALSSPTTRTSRRRLNPLFVEWLMGWPIGWTGCGSAATGYHRWLEHSRSALSMLRYSPMVKASGAIPLFGDDAA